MEEVRGEEGGSSTKGGEKEEGANNRMGDGGSGCGRGRIKYDVRGKGGGS
jgi:hypothetical protein